MSSLLQRLDTATAFGFGATIAVFTAVLRRYIPDSPRWLLAHGQAEPAEAVVEHVEKGRF